MRVGGDQIMLDLGDFAIDRKTGKLYVAEEEKEAAIA